MWSLHAPLPVEALRQPFMFEHRPNLMPRYNIAPTQDVPIVIEVTRLEKEHPTDVEELMSWTTRIVLFGGLVASMIIGTIGLSFCALSGMTVDVAY
jgi:hypothetical protein